MTPPQHESCGIRTPGESGARREAPGVEVRGALVDHQTRCRHYATALDVIAIRFHCCQRWYPCLHCHDDAEDHEITPWPAGQHNATALLCGVCRRLFSIAEYLRVDHCSSCGAMFNPACSTHHPVYFEA